MSALRALARVERREPRRHRARTLLVLLLVAVPVAAMVGGGALLEITTPTLEERQTGAMGVADLRVDGGELDALRALLPEGARVEALALAPVELRREGQSLIAAGFSAQLDGLAAGMLRVVEGRAPRGAHELALSPGLARGLGVAPGERVLVDGVERALSGLVLDPERLGRPLALLAPGAGGAGARRAWLVALPDPADATLLERLRAAGQRVAARADLRPGDGFEQLVSFVAGGFAFAVAGLVVAAAFAVGLRRRQRELGLLAATGARARDLRRALNGSALALAAAGALLGALVGIAAAALVHPALDGWNGRRNGVFELSPAHLVGGPAFALLAALGAVWLPARGATRLPVLVALSGRRPVAGAARGSLALGGALVAGGAALLALAPRADAGALGALVLGGSLCVALGLGALSPWLLERLARLAAPLPLAWRLALREAGRFRARNGPVVAAVMGAIAVSVLIAALSASVERMAAERAPRRPDDELVVRGPAAGELAQELARELGGRVVSGGSIPAESWGAGERWLLRLPAPVDEPTLARASLLAAAAPGCAIEASVPDARPERGLLRALLALCVATGLVVVLIATALSAAESAADAAVLHAVGAAPGLLRRLGAARAAWLALVGCALALPAGLAPAVGLLELTDVPLELALPWGEFGLALLGLPAAAWGLSWLAAALCPPPALRRRLD